MREKKTSQGLIFCSESNIFRVCGVYVGWLCGFYCPIEVCRDARVEMLELEKQVCVTLCKDLSWKHCEFQKLLTTLI